MSNYQEIAKGQQQINLCVASRSCSSCTNYIQGGNALPCKFVHVGISNVVETVTSETETWL